MSLFGPPCIEKLKAKKDIKRLINATCYRKDGHIRNNAIVALAEIGAPSVDPLIDALGDTIKKLRLTVNAQKSALDRPWKRSFLGFSFSRRDLRLRVARTPIQRLKASIRTLSRRTRGHSLNQIIAELRKTLLGWKAYFDLSEVLSPLRDLDKWIRRRLRCYVWKQWGRSGYRKLRKRGVSRELAWNTAKSAHGPWRLSRSPALAFALPARYFKNHGLPELAART